jgi:hypothetical protein
MKFLFINSKMAFLFVPLFLAPCSSGVMVEGKILSYPKETKEIISQIFFHKDAPPAKGSIPIAGASITLYWPNPENVAREVTAYSDNNGEFSISLNYPGAGPFPFIRIDADGFQSIQKKISL